MFHYSDNKFTEVWQTKQVKQSSKHFEFLVRNKSLHDVLSTFLKQVGFFFRDFSLYWFQNAFIFVPSGSTVKSPINSVFSYFLLYVSNALPVSPRWVATFRNSSPEVSLKKLFLEISQNSQENTCARVSFLTKLQA